VRTPAARTLTIVTLLFVLCPAAGSAQRKKPAAPAEVPAAAKGAGAAPPSEAALRSLSARGIGPAIMGGRVAEIALDPKDPYTFYVALGTGGLMKTSDNGGTFQAIFEKEAVAAIGAVAVAPSEPKVVWVGTGEGNDRNSSSWGNGVYRSTDAGATWTHVGLRDSFVIPRIVVHPRDPDTAWVAVLGDLWTPSPGRGLYKTSDAGKSWKSVLSAEAAYADRVGCGDVALDPSDPNTLYATLYARRRSPWSFVSGPDATDGKDLGGIFKSTDGGATWRKLGGGLPQRTQRIGLAVFAKNPRIVYAVVQTDLGGQSGIDDLKSKAGGVFRSEDGGESWKRVNDLNPRPFYFSQIRVDPENDRRVYLLGYMLHVSDDGGLSFREDHSAKIHADCHALVIDPRNPARLLLGTDGGPYQSFDRGKGWQHLDRMAAGEFYRISVDGNTPYRICGGLQDNINWVGPSMTRSKEGIRNTDWINIGGGDGFYCVFDGSDPDVVYAESQEGYLHRYNMRNGELKLLRPNPSEGHAAFRFHWNSPLIASLHAPDTLFLAGNRVFRLTGKAEMWEPISPDLSARDPEKTVSVGSGAENYGVVYTLAESRVAKGLLWAGTDDGKLWVTENEGGSWTDLSAALPREARGTWISRVEASHHDARVAYLVVDAHRTGVYSPLVWRTTDLGKTWKSVAADLPANGPVKVVREDPKNPDVLYAGTEFGLFVSVDRGEHWVRLGALPTVAVDDLVVHPRELDLVIATHGRSLYILDDLRPIQGLSAEVRGEEAHLFEPRPAVGFYPNPGWEDSNGNAVFRGVNPPEGALLTAWIREYTGEPAKIVITNSQDQPVANLTLPGTPGMNRISWDLKLTKDLLTEYGGLGAQKFVPSGEYKVTLTYGKLKQEQKLRVEIAQGVETR